MQAPCKGCEKRNMNCHSECEAYQAYNAENIKRREEKLHGGEARAFGYDSLFRTLKKTKWRR